MTILCFSCLRNVQRIGRPRLILVLLVLMPLLMLRIPPASAQDPTTQFPDGADIVFIVDQSGSMSGVRDGNPSDPFDLRADAVRYVIDKVGATKLYFNQQSRYRIGVVSFGDTAQIDMPLTELSAVNQAGWDVEREMLKSQVQAERLGFTNVAQGFAAAQQVFADAEVVPGNRARVVVLLTDGRPDLRDGPDETDDTARYFEGQLLPQVASAFPANDYRFYVVAIDDRGAFWPQTERYWQRAVSNRGFAERVQGSTDIPLLFTRILDEFIGTNARRLSTGPFDMPPYLQLAVFTVLKADPNSSAQIVQPDGAALAHGGDVQIENNGPLIQRVTVLRPLPGQWSITTDSNTRYDIYLEPLQSRLQLVDPTQPQPQQSQVSLTFQVLDNSGNPLPEAAGFPLTLNAVIQPPGLSALAPITLVRGQNEMYTTPAPITLDQAGEWQVEVSALVNNQPVLETARANFQVFSTTSVGIQIVAPLAGSTSQVRDEPLGPLRSTPIELHLVDGQGLPVTISDAFSNPLTEAISATLRSEGGAPTTIELEERERGILTADVPNLEPGNYSLSVTLSNKLNQTYVVPPGTETVIATFTRLEHPGQARAAMIRVVSIGVPSVLGALLMAGLLYMFTSQMRGRLVVLRGVRNIDSFDLPRRRRGTWKNPPPVTNLEQVRVYSEGKGRIGLQYREKGQHTWVKRTLEPERDLALSAPEYIIRYTQK